MTSRTAIQPPSNPFSSRFVRPGAIEYLFPDGTCVEEIINRLRQHERWGQVIGPHGSGKSTLLQTLMHALKVDDRRIEFFPLNQHQRRLPMRAADVASWDAETLVVVDGYEQLSWWSRKKLKCAARCRNAGLLVTAHADVGFPTIKETSVSLGEARVIVNTLLSDRDLDISDDHLERIHIEYGGNMREVLFSLYDVVEIRRRVELPGQ